MGLSGLYALFLIFGDMRVPALGIAASAVCLATVAATSMIYTQLKTVPRWHHWSTPALFLAHAVAGGALLAGQVSLAVVLLLALGAFQVWIWVDGNTRFARSGTTLGTATGLGDRGAVRSFEQPHTGPNYLTREMVHVVGRKHALKLRVIGVVLASLLPALLLLLPFSHVLAALAVLAHIAGSLVNRWLFFAEAEHVVGLYYGAR